MEVNYRSGCPSIFYPFVIGNRHLQLVFASNDDKTIQDLWNSRVIPSTENDPQISLLGRIKHLILGTLELIPVINIVIVVVERFFNRSLSTSSNLLNFDQRIRDAVQATPSFNSYSFAADSKVHLTDLDKRPANLLYKGIFGYDTATKPGSDQLFAFLPSPADAKRRIQNQPDHKVIQVSAVGEKGNLYRKKRYCLGQKSLETYLGKNTFEISMGEIKNVLESQKVFVSPLIPEEFYFGMKNALKKDGIITLPTNNNEALTLKEIQKMTISPSYFSGLIGTPPLYHMQQFLNDVERAPEKFGFVENGTMYSFSMLRSLSLYQLGAMIVKTEKYYPLVENGYTLAKRSVGDKDDLLLINAAGIRNFSKSNSTHAFETPMILKQMFKTALKAAGDGYLVMPAIGMGVWGGDPHIYWKMFLDALSEDNYEVEGIFINPGHQRTPTGKYYGCAGEEFEEILRDHKRYYPSKNYTKIVNLFDKKSDLLLLARNLKKACPDKTVALLNASDPDVTLGNHVGEYVNNLCHTSTTEENFTAIGTNGLCFEEMTGVLENPDRVIQVETSSIKKAI